MGVAWEGIAGRARMEMRCGVKGEAARKARFTGRRTGEIRDGLGWGIWRLL